MHVLRIQHLDDLLPFRKRWDELAGECPFRSWTWLSTWWKHYGTTTAESQASGRPTPRRELCVLLVFDNQSPCQKNPHHAAKYHDCCNSADRTDPAERSAVDATPGSLIAIAPFYIERSLTRGNVVRLLGDGEICSEHLSLLVASENTDAAAAVLADYLSAHASDWDLIDLTNIEASDVAMGKLCEALQSQACLVQQRAGQQRWAIPLPESWEEFLAMQSKSHRKQLRRMERYALNTDRAVWHLVDSPGQFDTAWEILVDLHQRRRNSLGEPGCFASPRFANFHREVAGRLLDAGQLQLSWLELDGQPASAEYNFSDSTTTYAYQGGIDPDRTTDKLGQLSLIKTIQHAIGVGHLQFDLLRGDEPYKAHWRAVPHKTLDMQVVSTHTGAKWRYQSWSQLRRARLWARGLVRSKKQMQQTINETGSIETAKLP